jgi:alkanesulfonate monooxygenase SsuD/methylene tetrahydromethanopterin reductase-like flavin-dependent oxidoreductase (luciferase family)
LKLGISIWSQGAAWSDMRRTAQLVDRLGYDHLWTFDHLLPNLGDHEASVHEGWLALATWAEATTRPRLGLMVGANTFRNPALVAKMAVTLDHASGGRAMLGLGSAWFALEHRAFGLEFGTGFRERGEWLAEALSIIRPLLAGERVTHAGPRYRVDALRLNPAPVSEHIPIVVGGHGRTTLPAVARFADAWSVYPEPDDLLRERRTELDGLAQAAGRDPSAIEGVLSTKVVIRDDVDEARRVWLDLLRRHGMEGYNRQPWLGPPAAIAERISRYRAMGFGWLVVDSLAPFDEESIERLATEVRPLLVA